MCKASSCFINLYIYAKTHQLLCCLTKELQECRPRGQGQYVLVREKGERKRRLRPWTLKPPVQHHLLPACDPSSLLSFPIKCFPTGSLRWSFEWGTISLPTFLGCQPSSKPDLLSIRSHWFLSCQPTDLGLLNCPTLKTGTPLWRFFFWDAQASSYS